MTPPSPLSPADEAYLRDRPDLDTPTRLELQGIEKNILTANKTYPRSMQLRREFLDMTIPKSTKSMKLNREEQIYDKVVYAGEVSPREVRNVVMDLIPRSSGSEEEAEVEMDAATEPEVTMETDISPEEEGFPVVRPRLEE